MDKTKELIQLLEKADIKINGQRPWDMQINHPKTANRILSEPSLGAGESYMDGWWDCQRLDEFFFRILRHLDLHDIYKPTTIISFFLKNVLINPQSKLRSRKVADCHYNVGNDLYRVMLGESMAYTCAYWRRSDSLDQAQFAKYDLICQKLQLKPGEKVLELGCGFGGFAKYAAEKYGVEMVSVNISTEQLRYAREICQGLPVTLFECDYRDVHCYNPDGIQFDKVVSIGLCEHIGHKNYKNLMKIVRNNIKEDGLFLLHTIGKNISSNFTDPWMQKYIFPEGMLPSVKALSEAAESYFVLEDFHNFGIDYDKTLMAWYYNFESHWSEVCSQYDERFYRMWCYYLLSCAGSFRARSMQLFQLVLSPRGVLDGYFSIR